MKRDDERSAAAKAQMILGTLTTSTLRTDEIVHKLRHAASLATAASVQSFSSDMALNAIRGEAGIALNGVAGSLDRGRSPLTQAMIDRAKTAVAEWLEALDAA
jgi:hypothetical protein